MGLGKKKGKVGSRRGRRRRERIYFLIGLAIVKIKGEMVIVGRLRYLVFE